MSKGRVPITKIDTLVDAAASTELMSLLDCYSGYHQIWMKKEDEPKASFITPSGTYCYLRMPEGLKNAGGSFNKMTAKVLHSQIGRTVLTYVDYCNTLNPSIKSNPIIYWFPIERKNIYVLKKMVI
jgi:hypothetical protein